MERFSRILVATDLSEVSKEVLRVAGDVARLAGAELIAAHIADKQGYAKLSFTTRAARHDFLANLRSTVKSDIEKTIGTDVPVRVAVALQERAVAKDVLAMATRHKVDLIVLGTHGRTGLRRALLGSVAEDVLRHATRPVLVVPMTVRVARRVPAGAVTATSTA